MMITFALSRNMIIVREKIFSRIMLMTINLSLSRIVITVIIFALSRIVIIQIIFFFFQNYEKFLLSFDNHDNFSVLPLDSHCRCQQYRHAAQVLLILIIIIIITRPKLAHGRQGLAGRSLGASGAHLKSGK